MTIAGRFGIKPFENKDFGVERERERERERELELENFILQGLLFRFSQKPV